MLPQAEYFLQALSDAEAKEWLNALEVSAHSHARTYVSQCVLVWDECTYVRISGAVQYLLLQTCPV